MLGLGSVLRAQILLQTVRTAQQLITVYMMLHVWGPVTYGDWVVLTSAATFFVSSDLGIQTVIGNELLRFGSPHYKVQFSLLLREALGLYATLIPALSLLTIMGSVALSSLHSGNRMYDLWASSTYLLAINFMINIPLTVLGSVYAARGDVPRGIDRVSLQTAAQLIMVGTCLIFSAGMLVVSLSILVTSLISIVVVLIDLRLRYRDISLRPKLMRWGELVSLLKRAWLYFLGPFVGSVYMNVPVFFIANLNSDSNLVALFAVSRTLIGLQRQLTTQIANALSVEIARTWALGEKWRCQELFSFANQFCSALNGVLSGAVLAVGPLFISTWTQGRLVPDWLLILALVSSVSLASPAMISLGLLQNTNQPGPLLKLSILQVAFGLFYIVVLRENYCYVAFFFLIAFTEAFLSIQSAALSSHRFGFPKKLHIVRSYGWSSAAGLLSFGACEIVLSVTPFDGSRKLVAVGLLVLGPLSALVFSFGFSRRTRVEVLTKLQVIIDRHGRRTNDDA